MHCDNEGIAYLSRNSGRDFEEIGYINHWPTTLVEDIPDVDDDTILRVECIDHGGIGGFIGSVEFPVGEDIYSTTNPLSSGNWKLTDSSDGWLFGLVYRERGGWPWYLDNRPSSVAPDAWWVWNGKTDNTMTYDFDFGTLDGVSLFAISVNC